MAIGGARREVAGAGTGKEDRRPAHPCVRIGEGVGWVRNEDKVSGKKKREKEGEGKKEKIIENEKIKQKKGKNNVIKIIITPSLP
jgi:hypothetical protein